MILPLFFCLLFFPSLLMVSLGQSSLASGLLLSILIVYFLGFFYISSNISSRKKINFKKIIFFVCFFIFLLLHFSLNNIRDVPLDIGRFIWSYVALMFFAIGCFIFHSVISELQDDKLSKIIRAILFFMLMNAICGVLGIKMFPHMSHKPVGVFSEPSHFALALAPFIIYSCVIKDRWYKFFLFVFFVFAVLVQNLTTMIVIILSLSLITRVRLKTFVPIFIAICIAVLFFAKSQYFTDRFSISAESDNISVVVLLRGWEMALLAFRESGLWGGGFQQFGMLGLGGELSDKLAALKLSDQNLYDGGSSAAKIIGELGVWGFAGLFFYLLLCMRCIVFLRHGDNPRKAIDIFFAACVLALLIELFVRGVGYFSTGFFLATTAVIGLDFRNAIKCQKNEA